MEATASRSHCLESECFKNVNVNVAPVPPPLGRTASSWSLSSIPRVADCSRFCMRPGPFDSQPCILMEIAVSVILIVASIMVLALSRNEKPHSLITLWIVGYASGCLATFPNLCLRYRRRPKQKQLHVKTLSALPMYKFKATKPTEGNESKYDCENPSKSSIEDGIVAVDTVQERSISSKDAICCICLRKYEDDEQLRELPCTHYFHVECVDKWLLIKASCPLCKHEFGQ